MPKRSTNSISEIPSDSNEAGKQHPDPEGDSDFRCQTGKLANRAGEEKKRPTVFRGFRSTLPPLLSCSSIPADPTQYFQQLGFPGFQRSPPESMACLTSGSPTMFTFSPVPNRRPFKPPRLSKTAASLFASPCRHLPAGTPRHVPNGNPTATSRHESTSQVQSPRRKSRDRSSTHKIATPTSDLACGAMTPNRRFSSTETKIDPFAPFPRFGNLPGQTELAIRLDFKSTWKRKNSRPPRFRGLNKQSSMMRPSDGVESQLFG